MINSIFLEIGRMTFRVVLLNSTICLTMYSWSSWTCFIDCYSIGCEEVLASALLATLDYNSWSFARVIIVGCLFLGSCEWRLFKELLGRVIDSIESSYAAAYCTVFLTILFLHMIDLLGLDAVVLEWGTSLPLYLSLLSFFTSLSTAVTLFYRAVASERFLGPLVLSSAS